MTPLAALRTLFSIALVLVVVPSAQAEEKYIGKWATLF